jgi:hypothetical protein
LVKRLPSRGAARLMTCVERGAAFRRWQAPSGRSMYIGPVGHVYEVADIDGLRRDPTRRRLLRDTVPLTVVEEAIGARRTGLRVLPGGLPSFS